jgi:predicted NAD/FAD-dependent oxidoreductase
MRVVVVGAGVAGLTAAGTLHHLGHEVTVVDKGRQPGGRLATKVLGGGARADHGAQFFTVRSHSFGQEVERWCAEGLAWEWCRGFAAVDGHPRYAAIGGMARLAGRMAQGLDVRTSVKVDQVRGAGGRWVVRWAEGHGHPSGSIDASAVVLTCPVPQAVALVDDEVGLSGLSGLAAMTYEPTLSLLVAIDGPAAVPEPGAVQLLDDPVWSWIADNVAKRVSPAPSVTFHTRADVAARRWGDQPDQVREDLLSAARPWLDGADVIDVVLHRWRYATPIEPSPDRCLVTADRGLVLAGDAFGGPRVEGAYLSGLAAADAVAGPQP